MASFQWISLFLPTFCLLYFNVWSNTEPAHTYYEVLGNNGIYLRLSYATKPDGILQAGNLSGIPIRGELVEGDIERPVRGIAMVQNRKKIYRLEFAGGEMILTSLNKTQRCDPSFHYVRRSRKDGQSFGTVRGAFCLSEL